MNKYASTYINAFNKTAEDLGLASPEIDPLNNPEGQWNDLLPNTGDVRVARPTISPLDLLENPPVIIAPPEVFPAAKLPSLGYPEQLPFPEAPSLIGISEPTTLNAGQ